MDSQAAIIALTTLAAADSYHIIQCHKLINELIEKNVRMVLQWIPSLSGNEEANGLGYDSLKGLFLLRP